MSGKRANMGQLKLIYLAANNPEILCVKCEPRMGWGWKLHEKDMDWRKNLNSLPRAGNGFEVIGKCSYCLGTGISPMPIEEIY